MLGRAVVARGPSRPAVSFPSRWSYYTSDFVSLRVRTRSRRAASQAARSLPPCLHPHRLGAPREFNAVNLTKPSVSWRAYACVLHAWDRKDELCSGCV